MGKKYIFFEHIFLNTKLIIERRESMNIPPLVYKKVSPNAIFLILNELRSKALNIVRSGKYGVAQSLSRKQLVKRLK